MCQVDAKHETDLLVSGVNGLGMGLSHGGRQLDDVVATIDYHLTRLFGEPELAVRR